MLPTEDVDVAALLRPGLKEGVGADSWHEFPYYGLFSHVLVFESRWSDASHLNIYIYPVFTAEANCRRILLMRKFVDP